MKKTATCIALLALTGALGGCFSYTHQTTPAPAAETTVVQHPNGSTTTTTTTPPPN